MSDKQAAVFADHLDGIGEILASVRQVSDLVRDLAGTKPMSMPTRDVIRLTEIQGAFFDGYGNAVHEGIRDEDDARDLLRDAVNLVLSMASVYARGGGSDFVLIDRSADVLEEFRPGYERHCGLAVGDRVEQRVGGFALLSGEVIELDPLDNNRATVRDDRDGEETSVTCDACVQTLTFRKRVTPPAPAPR